VSARCKTTYNSTNIGSLVKLTEKSCFKFALGVIVGLVCFQNLVETLIQKRLEVMQWPQVVDACTNMRRIVVIQLDHTRSI
jgi:hypothetical protein